MLFECGSEHLFYLIIDYCLFLCYHGLFLLLLHSCSFLFFKLFIFLFLYLKFLVFTTLAVNRFTFLSRFIITFFFWFFLFKRFFRNFWFWDEIKDVEFGLPISHILAFQLENIFELVFFLDFICSLNFFFFVVYLNLVIKFIFKVHWNFWLMVVLFCCFLRFFFLNLFSHCLLVRRLLSKRLRATLSNWFKPCSWRFFWKELILKLFCSFLFQQYVSI